MGDMKSGVYAIRTPSGRLYIGSAINFSSRWRVHRHHLRAGTHHNKPLQAAWDKYGERLVFERLIACKPEHVILYEQIVINALRPAMNVLARAGSSLGYKHTEETKARFGLRKKGTLTPAGLAARREKMTGFQMTDAHKAIVSMAHRGKVISPELRDRLRAANKGRRNTQEQIDKQKKAFALTIQRRREGVSNVI